MATEVTKTIQRLETLNCSKNANPRFRVHCTDGTVLETQADVSANYGLQNPEFQGVPVTFRLSRAGRITHASTADGRQA